MNPGKLFKIHEGEQCSNCTKPFRPDNRAMMLEVKIFTEDGWRDRPGPIEYWLFCCDKCLMEFAVRTCQLHVDAVNKPAQTSPDNPATPPTDSFEPPSDWKPPEPEKE